MKNFPMYLSSEEKLVLKGVMVEWFAGREAR
jgi:hypothetical protein